MSSPALLVSRRTGFREDGKKKRGKYGNAVHPSDLAALNTEALFLFPFGLYLLTRFIWLSVHSGWLRGDFKW